MILKTAIPRWKLVLPALAAVLACVGFAVRAHRHPAQPDAVAVAAAAIEPEDGASDAEEVSAAEGSTIAFGPSLTPPAPPLNAAGPDPRTTTATAPAPPAPVTIAPATAPLAASAQTPAVVAKPAPEVAVPTVADPALIKLPVNARHMLVMDDNGHVLAAKDADAIVPIASLSKLMTAMVVLDAHQDPAEILQIEEADVDHLKHSASRVAVGAKLSRAAAFEIALMASENRAASVLARHYPGGMPAFESALQAKIRALGLTRTALTDPTGLSPENTSTAAEVARIAVAASHYAEITRITSDKATKVAINGRPRDVHNTNHLVGGKGWDIRLSKTGYTNEAGRCLTMRMKSGGQTITVVLLDADGSAQRLRDAATIRKSLAKKLASI